MIRSLIARGAAALALLSLIAAPAMADITVKDGTGASQTIRGVTCGTGICYGMANFNNSGVWINPATDDTLKAAQSAPGVAPTTPFNFQGVAGGTPIDTVVKGPPTNRSAVIGFAGSAAAASSASTSLTVTTTSNFTNQAGALSGIPMVGQIVAGTGITAATTITAVTANSATSYALTLSAAATVASGAAITSGGPQQIMPANTARRGVQQQNQGAGDCYQNGTGLATIGPDSLLLPSRSYTENPQTHVNTGAIADVCTAAATPIFAREYQ